MFVNPARSVGGSLEVTRTAGPNKSSFGGRCASGMLLPWYCPACWREVSPGRVVW
jgi:hypothetical protein